MYEKLNGVEVSDFICIPKKPMSLNTDKTFMYYDNLNLYIQSKGKTFSLKMSENDESDEKDESKVLALRHKLIKRLENVCSLTFESKDSVIVKLHTQENFFKTINALINIIKECKKKKFQLATIIIKEIKDTEKVSKTLEKIFNKTIFSHDENKIYIFILK